MNQAKDEVPFEIKNSGYDMQGKSSGSIRNAANLSAAKKLTAAMPDVRADVVASAIARMESGELFSAAAALETARAMLRS